jgi:exosome complex component RRP41
MSRYEIYSPEGLRIDGRRWNELRQFKCQINTHPNAVDGSSYVELGATKVICLVRGPQEPESKLHSHSDKAYVSVSVNVSPFSTIDRNKRLRNDRRIQELQLNLQRTFQEAILDHLHPRTEISITLHILTQDGGLTPACVNATTLALTDAGIPLYDYVCSCSTAIYDTTPLLDPNNMEESDLSSLTVAVIGESDKILMMLLENRMALDRIEPVVALTLSGCHSIRDQMDREIRKHGKERLAKKINV